MGMISKARAFATRAHGEIGQKRKYSGEPYIVHPAAVAAKVTGVSDDERLIAAAWLHDTVEDTPATLEDIRREFGDDVHDLVENLTDVSTPKDGNRRFRKEMDREHSAKGSPGAKTVKLADLIHNAESILVSGDGFAYVFIPEMKRLLAVLKEGNEALHLEATEIVHAFETRRARQKKKEQQGKKNNDG